MTVVNEAKAERKAAARERRAAGDVKDSWRGFVNVDLSAADKEAIRAGDVGFDDAWGFLMQRVLEGYKLSLSFDHGNSSWVASLTCKRSSDANVGLCLTARGGRVEGAVLALWYKDDVLLARSWSGRAQGGRAAYEADDVG